MADDELTYINEKFQDLLKRINAMNNTLSNLDLLRIQMVYSTGKIPKTHDSANEYEWPLSDFVATCWSKLSVYRAVYFDIPENSCLVWQRNGTDPDLSPEIRIRRGDYLIKMPDNNSIYVVGNDTYVYVPTSYNASSGQLLFKLINQTTAATEPTVVVPAWNTGSGTGNVATWYSTTAASAITVSMVYSTATSEQIAAAIYSGTYFLNQEQIVIPPKRIDINYDSAPTISITFSSGITINEAYIPYNFG